MIHRHLFIIFVYNYIHVVDVSIMITPKGHIYRTYNYKAEDIIQFKSWLEQIK